MKRLLTLTIGLIFSASLLSFAGSEKERKWSKTYSINSGAILELESSFGDIRMETWDKNEIYVEITFVVQGKSESDVDKALAKCEVDANGSSSLVSIETSTGNGSWGNKIEKMETNIIIKAPSSIGLDLDHRFGDASFPLLEGNVTLDIQHGDIRIEGMEDANNEIELAFSDAIFGSIYGAKMDIQHSDVKIRSIEALNMDNQFSDIKIKELGVKLFLDCQHGDVDIYKVGPKMKEIMIDIQFGDVTMELDESVAWKLEGDLSFSSISLPDGVNKRRSDEDKDWSNSFEIQAFHGENSEATIEIDAQHSSVDIRFE